MTGGGTKTWTAAASNNWSLAGDLNWAEGDKKFFNGDSVIFGNTANSGTVAISGTLAPFDIQINNTTLPYLFSGSGTIGGSAALTKSGTGTATISTSNSFTGVTAVNAGVLNIQNATSLGSTAGGTTVASGAALQIQGGISTPAEPLTLNGSGVANDGALRNIADSNTYSGLVTLGSPTRINANAGVLLLSNTGTITGSGFGLTVGGAGVTNISGVIGTTAGSLTKEDAGSLILTGANSYSVDR